MLHRPAGGGRHDLHVHAVPLRLGQRVLAVQLELERVVRAQPDALVLRHDRAVDPQCAALRVEVDALHGDREEHLDLLAVDRAGARLLLHLAPRGRQHAVALCNQVVRVPQVLRLLGHQRDLPVAVDLALLEGVALLEEQLHAAAQWCACRRASPKGLATK